MMASLSSSAATVIGAFGRPVVGAFVYAVDLTVFIWRSLTDRSRHRRLWNRASRRAVVAQVIFTGVDALPSILILSLALGVGVIAQLVLALQEFGTQSYVVTVITNLVALELGALLTAIFLVSRSGSAITVDLLNMKINNEIHALELLGININDFLIVPRLIGCSIAQVVLAIVFSFLTLTSAVIITAAFAPINLVQYFSAIVGAFTGLDIAVFLFKNALFGLIIASVACFHGLQIRSSVTEIPQQTQKAIVSTLVVIFVLDGILAGALG